MLIAVGRIGGYTLMREAKREIWFGHSGVQGIMDGRIDGNGYGGQKNRVGIAIFRQESLSLQ